MSFRFNLRSFFSQVLLVGLSVSVICATALSQTEGTPKWDVFVGYQYLNPGGTVPQPFSDPNSPLSFKIPAMSKGFGSSLTYNFDSHWGAEADFGHNWGDSNYETTLSGGPRFMWRTDDAHYFVHALASYNRLSVSGLNGSNGIGAILGGGIDLPFTKHFAWRLFEADYVWARHNYADFAAPEFPELRRPSLEGVRLRTGVVLSWGGSPELAPAANCSIQPSEVMVGEPLTATVTASNFNPKHTVTYSWTGSGAKINGKDTTATIETTDVAPGNYTVTVHVTDAKAKNNNEASCSANFTVKPLPPKNPPTMSLSANPGSVVTGGNVDVSANCTSPDGVPVSVANWTSTGGTVSGNGNSATLSTNGAAPGSITVAATCSDSRGLTAQASTGVTVENPPPPPIDVQLEARLRLGHSVYFPTAKPPVKDPSAGLLPSQQQTLLAFAADFNKYLKAKPDAHITLEGHADIRGSVPYNQALSERRTARVKSFLVENGIPEGAIETRGLGKEHNLTTEEVREAVNQNPELTSEERARVMRNIVTIRMASNRRVDISLSNTGQISKREFPFNATDALTLIGGRTSDKKPAAPAKKTTTKKKAPAKK